MREQEKSVESGDTVARAPSGAPRLLVIDDDDLHRMIVCRAAIKAGYLVVQAASYDEAAQLAHDGKFDCITLDLSLGGHAGRELLQHFWVIGCKAPVIIISGADEAVCRETVDVARSLKFEVLEPVPKPVDLSLLRFTLERLKQRQHQASAA
jgi:two-component system, chemotaxis family, chemotaxis protein CheY